MQISLRADPEISGGSYQGQGNKMFSTASTFSKSLAVQFHNFCHAWLLQGMDPSST